MTGFLFFLRDLAKKLTKSRGFTLKKPKKTKISKCYSVSRKKVDNPFPTKSFGWRQWTRRWNYPFLQSKIRCRTEPKLNKTWILCRTGFIFFKWEGLKMLVRWELQRKTYSLVLCNLELLSESFTQEMMHTMMCIHSHIVVAGSIVALPHEKFSFKCIFLRNLQPIDYPL